MAMEGLLIVKDHVYTIVGPFLKSPSLRAKSVLSFQNLLDFFGQRRGVIAAPNGFSGMGFLKSPQAE